MRAGVAVGREVPVDSAAADFPTFVRAYTPALLRTAYLLTGSSASAEELVQDTLVRLYPKWHRVAAADVPLAYVRRSLTNGYINSQRRASRREVVVEFVPDAANTWSTDDRVADRDEVWAMLHTLPDRQRAALVLRYFSDLPDEEIAAALECRPGTVRSLISRGLAALREGAVAPRSSS